MKPLILFVDDDSRVLESIRRSLREMRDAWEMEFATDGAHALDMLAARNFDVVVSDIKMPGMSGIELLRQVRERYPDVIRIVLSGHYGAGGDVDGIEGDHQVLSKPCDKDVLITTINGTLAARELAGDANAGDTEKLASGLEKLADSLFRNGYVSAFEVPVRIQDERARAALKALIPESANILEDSGNLTISLRIELTGGTEEGPRNVGAAKAAG